jgi:excisionase family DNA binding protein
MPLQENKILIDKKSAAQMLSISLRALDYLIAQGELPVRRLGRRCLIERRALEQFARRDHKYIVADGEKSDEIAAK